jgi:hypothetical protein
MTGEELANDIVSTIGNDSAVAFLVPKIREIIKTSFDIGFNEELSSAQRIVSAAPDFSKTGDEFSEPHMLDIRV